MMMMMASSKVPVSASDRRSWQLLYKVLQMLMVYLGVLICIYPSIKKGNFLNLTK